MMDGANRHQSSVTYSLERYLNEISRIELLEPQQEVNLTRQIRQGDQEALNQLVKANLRFVVKVAKEYQNQGLPLVDLIHEGNLGLIKAANRFDETRGFRFISYAVWWIRQSILQALAEHARIVRLPLNRVSLINKVNVIIRELSQQYDREPTLEEISKVLDASATDIKEALVTDNFYLSLDQPSFSSDEGNLKDYIRNPNAQMPDASLLSDSLKEEIRRVLKTLSSREEKIIKMYFGLDYDRPLTLEEIGDRLNLTRERVRQIKERALIRLRHQSRCQNLRLFL
ncbi:MAG: sigma-70 family RNA polymerase sigma factor [Calditrichaeota bacterium]|nr:sigma-70 family RNA polymerase sigma factor [Calditrichota bacterium]